MVAADPFFRPQRQVDLDFGLQKAIAAGDGQGVYRALDNGANIDAHRDGGNTPVMLATLISSDHILTQLLNRKGRQPDLTLKNDKGETALHLAAKRAGTSFANYLVEAGAPVDAADKEGNTPLHVAAKSGFGSLAITCIEKGADVNAPNAKGETPLVLAAHERKWSTVADLMKHGASADCRNKDGMTPLMLVAVFGEFAKDLAAELLARGADPLQEDHLGLTALMYAACAGNTPVLKILLAAKDVDLNAPNARGRTPFYCAADMKQWEAMEILMDHGALPRFTGPGGIPLLTLAVKDPDCPDALLQRFLKAGLDPQQEDDAGMTPLMHAAAAGRLEAALQLALNKAYVFYTGQRGIAAPEIAREAGYTALAETLAGIGKEQAESIAGSFRTGTDRPAKTIRKLTLKPAAV